ncbi:uncharacterized protein LOC124154934 [Ischnura elegans]|uniref:uncharacterized protein LOC124154934 n=1 Tax=Ischnura elegans TaxID=197161 RepID=UPI001ED88F60|nr:uncharacterized protein LOC124154934 [Ischnura elegans]
MSWAVAEFHPHRNFQTATVSTIPSSWLRTSEGRSYALYPPEEVHEAEVRRLMYKGVEPKEEWDLLPLRYVTPCFDKFIAARDFEREAADYSGTDLETFDKSRRNCNKRKRIAKKFRYPNEPDSSSENCDEMDSISDPPSPQADAPLMIKKRTHENLKNSQAMKTSHEGVSSNKDFLSGIPGRAVKVTAGKSKKTSQGDVLVHREVPLISPAPKAVPLSKAMQNNGLKDPSAVMVQKKIEKYHEDRLKKLQAVKLLHQGVSSKRAPSIPGKAVSVTFRTSEETNDQEVLTQIVETMKEPLHSQTQKEMHRNQSGDWENNGLIDPSAVMVQKKIEKYHEDRLKKLQAVKLLHQGVSSKRAPSIPGKSVSVTFRTSEETNDQEVLTQRVETMKEPLHSQTQKEMHLNQSGDRENNGLRDDICNLEKKVVEHMAMELQKLSCLEEAINTILIKLDNLNSSSENCEDFEDVRGLFSLPVNSIDELQSVQNELTSPKIRKYMFQLLKDQSPGLLFRGLSQKEVNSALNKTVYSCLASLMTNDLALRFCMKGKSLFKVAFEVEFSELIGLIFDIVKEKNRNGPEIDISMVKKSIGEWLRLARLRMSGGKGIGSLEAYVVADNVIDCSTENFLQV